MDETTSIEVIIANAWKDAFQRGMKAALQAAADDLSIYEGPPFHSEQDIAAWLRARANEVEIWRRQV